MKKKKSLSMKIQLGSEKRAREGYIRGEKAGRVKL